MGKAQTPKLKRAKSLNRKQGEAIQQEDENLEEDLSMDEGENEQPHDEEGDTTEKLEEHLGAAEEDATEEGLTDFQALQRKQQRQIQEIEEARVEGNNWSMGGEVPASKRPMDSLLTEQLDFDTAMKPVPVITERITSSLEETIRRRVRDANFDDVARKAAHTNPEDLEVSKRETAAESEKSRLSLMDLYEKDYLDRLKAAEAASGDTGKNAEPLTEVEKDEFKAIQMWKRLGMHLDALSNYFFTPKPVQPDLDARQRAVANSVPAIALESVGMSALSSEKVLAPQDLHRPGKTKYADAAVEELSPEEKRRLRNAKKASAKATAMRAEKQKAVRTKATKRQREADEASKTAK